MRPYATSPKSATLGVVLLFIAGIALAAAGGIALGLSQFRFALVLVSPIVLVVVYLALSQSALKVDLLFISLLGMAMLIPVANRTLQVQVSWLLEAALALLAPIVVLRARRAGLDSGVLWGVLIVYLLFLVFGIISSAFGRSNAIAGLYQLFTHIKIVLLLSLGFAIAWKGPSEQFFWWLVRWLWLPLTLLIAWQWLHPSSYIAIFHSGARTPHPFPWLPSRALGMFQHSSFLALYSSIFCMAALFIAIFRGQPKHYGLALIYGCLLLASGQRQELAALTIVLFAIYTITKLKENFLLHGYVATILLILMLALGWFLLGGSLEEEAYRWGIVGNNVISQPRPLIYLSAIDIANEYFPTGSGFGTFAGPGAERFDISLHLQYGFGRFNWFYSQNVLSDAALANVLAETGWIGTSFFLASLALLNIYTARGLLVESSPFLRVYWALAFGGVLFGTILLASSPSFQDPGLSLLLTVFVGVASNMSRTDRAGVTLKSRKRRH